MALTCSQIRPEVRQHLTQARHLELGYIECSEPLVDIVEPVREPVQVQRSEINRRAVISDSPQWAVDRAAAHA